MSIYLTSALNKLISFITSIPSIAICFGITVISLYFICVDKIYIIDQLEHHMPKTWIRKLKIHFNDLILTLRWIFKSSNYINNNIIYYMFSWVIYS